MNGPDRQTGEETTTLGYWDAVGELIDDVREDPKLALVLPLALLGLTLMWMIMRAHEQMGME